MASDVGYDCDAPSENQTSFGRFALALRVSNIDQAERFSASLRSNSNVQIPSKPFPRLGMELSLPLSVCRGR